MKKNYCDIRGCKEEAYNLEVMMCSGWKESSGDIKYKPFELPELSKKDLCDKHFDKWCKATYKAFWKVNHTEWE